MYVDGYLATDFGTFPRVVTIDAMSIVTFSVRQVNHIN